MSCLAIGSVRVVYLTTYLCIKGLRSGQPFPAVNTKVWNFLPIDLCNLKNPPLLYERLPIHIIS